MPEIFGFGNLEVTQMRSSLSTAGAESSSEALVGLAAAMLLASLGASVANIALPGLGSAFGATFQQVQWIVLAYLLSVTTLVVSAGRLGDVIGRKRLLLIGLAVFAAASIGCALAVDLGALIAARAVQGVGAAIMMTLSMALAREAVPKEKLGAAMGALGATSAIGTALGPAAGGFIIRSLGWPAIFAILAPCAMLAIYLVWRYLPRQQDDRSQQFDVLGALLLALALGAYALTMTVGRGRFGLENLALLGAAVVLVGLFVRVEARVRSPLVRLSMFRAPNLSAGLAASMLVAALMMATLIVGPFYLSAALGLEIRTIGLIMAVGPLVAALAGIPAGRIVDRFGATPTTFTAVVGLATGALAFAMLPEGLGIAGYVAPIAVITAAYALFQAANNTALMTQAAAEERGVVSALANLSRNLGLITGASVLGAVFALASGMDNIAALTPRAALHGLHLTFAAGAVSVVVAGLILLRAARRTAMARNFTHHAPL